MKDHVRAGGEQIDLTPEQAIELLPDSDYVHTFKSGPGILVGCDWKKRDLIREIQTGKSELAGPAAQAMKHGLAVHTKDRGAIFVQTVPIETTKWKDRL